MLVSVDSRFLAGNTPMSHVDLKINDEWRRIRLKREGSNPAGSVKDRTAASLLHDLEMQGLIGPDTTIVESTSGNLGVALAYLCRAKNYRFMGLVDPKTPPEACSRMMEFGARLDLVTEPDENGGYLISRLRRIKELCSSHSQYVWTNQYSNSANPLAHYLSTGPEIHHQTSGAVDAVFIAVSTGGTLAGVGRYFRETKPDTRIIAVDAAGSVVFGALAGTRKLTGIGSSRKSDFITPDLYDCHVIVTDQQAFSMCRQMSRLGIHLGGSSGAALVGCAMYLAKHPEVIDPVCICPDDGNNYLSTIYNDAWLLENGFDPENKVDCFEHALLPSMAHA
ncbi:MAG TPA: pyridoxal-phosphate dependent enzyme [Candidatus Angelobacter sp.]|nr:pyridoxal-phosphate dependent enzyme [Candidatus Angelobacter sp.]